MGERQLKFLEFIPLILYFTFARAANADSSGLQRETAFVVGGVVSIATLTVLMRNKPYTLNRIMLGVDLFLMSGALAVLFRFEALLDLYRRLDPAPMFAWVLAVGMLTSLLSPCGFVGSPTPDPKRRYLDSALLLSAAVVALGISLLFRGKIVYADILPLIGLFIVGDRLQSRTQQGPG